jgi:hypothetical protein
MATWRRRLLMLQAGYYGITGIWPLMHLRSFEAVTGPKTDDWLVHMVGLLAAAIGLVLGVSVRRGSVPTPEITLLAMSSALAFAAIDVWYGLIGRISPVYLGDAVVQICLILGLIFLGRGFVGSPPASDRR